MNEFTDAYTFKLQYREIPKQDIKDQFVSVELKSDYTYAFHFFEWKFRAVWEYGFGDFPLAYSEVEGILTPQAVKDSNKNITSAFKGPVPTMMYFTLIPTQYVNEVEGVAHTGYRVHLNDFERGSTVNKRTLVNRYQATGEEFTGFRVQLMINNGSTLYQVRIQKIKSILEVVAYMLGFLAGFILIVRGAKYYLLKETYFLELEKQCEKLFGRHNELKHEDDEDEATNIELMRLERTRMRARNSRDSHNDSAREETKLNNRNADTVQLDGSELNDDEEDDLKQLQI